MRCFSFCNQYLSGIHTGLQFGHAVDQMWLKYVGPYLQLSEEWEGDELTSLRLLKLAEFSRHHKTFIALNGGDHERLKDLKDFFNSPENPYPFQYFEEPGLNFAITSVVIVIPESLYDDVAQECGRGLLKGTPGTSTHSFAPWEQEFLKRKAACGLAT